MKHTHTHIQNTAVARSHSSLFSTASDNCEIHSLCTKTWPGRKIISVIELMGLSETGEQPRAATAGKREEKKNGKETAMCMGLEKEKRVSEKKDKCRICFDLFCD